MTTTPSTAPAARVRLRRLELHGFKTFASRAVLEFAPGITAVVGPNGSGKSNVADAVRWVLGEQSLRLLRGRKAEDIIFAGGSGRAPLGMAEVHLTLENPGGALPLDFQEVEICRRAYRSGESEYFLNKGRVRLRDVTDVLSRAGIGHNGHSVIGQGMVDLALSLRPEERRALFEDAGGQRRFHAKKAEAETKLTEVHGNATRVADVIAELEPRLSYLQRQARRAQDEARLRGQLRDATISLLAHQRWELERALQQWQPRVEALQAAGQQAAQETRAAQAAAEQARQRLAALRQRLDTTGAERGAARDHHERAQRDLAVAQERLRAGERTAQDSSRLAQRLEARAKEAAQAVETAAHAHAGVEARLAEARAALAAIEQADRGAEGSAGPDEAALRGAEEAAAQAARHLTQITTRLREAERQAGTLDKQQGEALDGQRRAREALAGTTQRLTALAAQFEQRRAATQQLTAARDEAARARATAEREAQQHAAARQALERQIGELEARLSVLRDVAGPSERGSTGAQRAETTLRRVAEHLRVPPEMEAAVAAAAGPALEWIVVDTPEDAAARALDRATGGGDRATFLPSATTARAPAGAADLPPHEGGLGYLADLLDVEPDGAPLHRLLLGDAYVVRDLSLALSLAGRLNGGPRPRIVTLNGEAVHALGAVTAGAVAGEAATLRRLRDLREAEAALERLRPQLVAARAAIDAGAHDLERHRRAEREAEQRLRDLAQQDSREEGERRALTQQQGRLQRDAAWWDEYAGRTQAQIESIQEQLQTLRTEQTTAQAQHDAARTRADALIHDAARQRAALAAQREQVASARTKAAVAEQQSAQAMQRALQARQALQGAQVELDEAHARARKAENERATHAQHASEAAQAVQAAQARVTASEQAFASARNEARELEAELERQRARAEQAAATQANAQRDVAFLEAERATLAERLRALHEHAAREVGELPPARESETPAADLQAKVESLQSRLRALGPVNQVALQEHAEASERLDFLKTQLDDLNRSAASLEAAKAELDARLDADFGQTFREVAEHFRVYFNRLFGGGDAALTLTDPKNLAETGIEVTAQLPGKRRQELALLSGGERALVAAALLFALLKARPSPFCVMDEVDAALDEANVGRFCDVLEELSHQTQFVVVTHNRATMERADTLYGVTLGEDGVSRIISLNVKEALPSATNGVASNGSVLNGAGSNGHSTNSAAGVATNGIGHAVARAF